MVLCIGVRCESSSSISASFSFLSGGREEVELVALRRGCKGIGRDIVTSCFSSFLDFDFPLLPLLFGLAEEEEGSSLVEESFRTSLSKLKFGVTLKEDF